MDARIDGSLMPFKIFRTLFHKSMNGAFCATENNSFTLKTYNQPSMKQLSVCTVIVRHKVEIAKCRF